MAGQIRDSIFETFGVLTPVAAMAPSGESTEHETPLGISAPFDVALPNTNKHEQTRGGSAPDLDLED